MRLGGETPSGRAGALAAGACAEGRPVAPQPNAAAMEKADSSRPASFETRERFMLELVTRGARAVEALRARRRTAPAASLRRAPRWRGARASGRRQGAWSC